MSVVAISMSNIFLLDHVSDNIDTDCESDRYSDISMDSFHPSDASSRTTVSMRSSSPAPSVYSVTSSLRAQSVRYEHGRGLNNYSEVYRLPADDAEIERLGQCFYLEIYSAAYLFVDAQHEMMKKIMGKYPSPLPEVLADNVPGETKAVLDLGCGSGSW